MATLLFAPNFIIEFLKLNDFIEKYEMYFGIVFLLSTCLLIVHGVLYLVKSILPNDSDKIFFIDIISNINNDLLLDDWDNIINNAKHGSINNDLVLSSEKLNNWVTKTIWPRKYLKIKQVIFSINKKYKIFIDTFKNSAENKGEIWIERKIEGKESSRLWIPLLENYVRTLNKLIVLSHKYFSNEKGFPKTFRTKKQIWTYP